MKTAAERAEKFVALPELADISDKRELIFAVYELLKEQDWLTREACAEATIKLARTVSQCSTVGYCKSYNDAIISAHDACLNVKAV